MTDAVVTVVAIALVAVGAAAAIAGIVLVGYAAWCRIAGGLGRYLAARDSWTPLTDHEVAQNGRLTCESITVVPLHPPHNPTEDPT
jgi:hypothetical protein